MENLEKWNRLAKVPLSHLKTITFGALKGKSDINPQWRYKAMTEVYGECGTGWSHRLVKTDIVDGANGEVLIFMEVVVSVGGKEWPGFGGDKIIVKDKNGLHSNDEAMKMAYTDALGTALKYVGVASEIYEGNFDGSRYSNPVAATPQPITEAQATEIKGLLAKTNSNLNKFLICFKVNSVELLLDSDYANALDMLSRKAAAQEDGVTS